MKIARSTGLRRALWHLDVAFDGSGLVAGRRLAAAAFDRDGL